METSHSLHKLIDLDELQSVQDNFAKAVGISSVIFSPQGEPLTEFTNPTGFCSLIQSTGKGKERCFRSFLDMSRKALECEEPRIFYCFAHGGHFVAPIVIGGEYKATMFAGQFIPDRFSSHQLTDLKDKAVEIGLEPELLVKEAKKMRVVKEDAVCRYSILLFEIVEVIARRGLQAAELSQANEALEKAHDELDFRVQQRTAELAKANAELKHEIAERKSTVVALQDSESKIRTMTTCAQDAVIMMDDNGKISFWNRAAERIFGYTEEETMGKALHATLAPERFHQDYLKGIKMFRETGRGGAVEKTVELVAVRKDGTEFAVELSLSSVKLKGKWNAIGLMRDITNRKAAHKELARTNKLLEEAVRRANQLTMEARAANKAKSEFLANMSHEIRTPMNGVIGMTGLLLDTELTPEQRQFATTIEESADSLLAIINDILDFSKIEARKLETETLDFDLRVTLEDMTDMLAIRAHEKDLEMTCLIEPEVPSLLRGDPGRLRQILTNLAGNAIKFTLKGEVIVQVALDHEDENEAMIRFSVKDTGIGIPADKLGTLFDSFTQADSSTTRKFGGTGLGLTISRRLCEIMGGRIGVESKEGIGSTFWFTACLKKQPPDRKREITARQDTGLSLKDVRILAVDDNATNRRVLAGMLSLWGCRHEEVEDAGTALERLRAAVESGDPFRIAILDMLMPETDGETLGKMIKDDPAVADTVLVMMSSLGVHGDVIRFKQEGFAAYLTKPVKQSRLFECLMTVLGRRPGHEASPQGMITRHTLAEERKQKIRILIAEDNIVNQKVALKILEKLGYRANAVANGAEAVRALDMIPYDIVLMDVQMPEMDGLEATKEIRRLETACPGKHPSGAGRQSSIQRVPIIAMTAHAMKGDREMCLNAGMDDYLTKPVQPVELAETIARWVSGAAAVQETQTAEKPSGVESGFDRTVLLHSLGGNEKVCREIIGMFLEDLPGQIESMEDAVKKGDPVLVQRLAHTIKGASASVGAVALQKAALEMEKAGKSGDMGKAAGMLDAVKETSEILKKILKKINFEHRMGKNEGMDE